jgi:hypothetical protein
METFLLFILGGIGITNLVVNASILDIPRSFVINSSDFFGKLITCMMCFGFWVGFFLAIFFGFNPILAGATISLLSFAFSYLIEYAEIIVALRANELELIDKVEGDE